MPGVGRLKTGTPARIDGRTIDFTELAEQKSQEPCPLISYWQEALPPKQVSCHITYTNEKTHDIINESLHLSAMYSGNIESKGPRYCPSIEDKIVRFAEQQRHQVFLEPEGLNTSEVYPNGISTSLPIDVQQRFINSIKGCEKLGLSDQAMLLSMIILIQEA